ncbi:MAG: hypothetical protein ACI9T7_000401 [Oleiphilaceae bacterium]|jgi:hypothetical protein
MLNYTTVYYCLSFLALSVALNFWLTFKLLKVVNAISPPETSASSLSIGSEMLSFNGILLSTEQTFDFYTTSPVFSILLFMSTKCDKCKENLQELESLYALSDTLGLAIWLIFTDQPRHVRYFLNQSSLLSVAVKVTNKTSIKLNPHRISPYYLFIDENRRIQTSGLMGDKEWTRFQDQISNMQTDEQS